MATAPGALDRALTRGRTRAGRRYLEALFVVVGIAVVFVVVPAYSAMLVPYMDASLDEYLRIVVAFALVLGPLGTIGMLLIGRRTVPGLLAWLRGDRSSPQAAWESSVIALPPLAMRIGALYAVCCIPPALYARSVLGLSWVGWVLYLLFLCLMILGAVVVGYLLFEQALRPVLREIAAALPEDFRPTRAAPTLGAKLLALILAINVVSGMTIAAVSTNDLGPDGRLAVTLVATLAVSATLSLGLSLLVRNSLLRRLDGLQEAIDLVDRGDFSARVLTVAGDELDTVGGSFNRMVSGLRQRDTLQHALGSYVDPAIAARVAMDGAAISGEGAEVTVMFIDIVGFTKLAEGAPPEDVVSDLNDFFDQVVPAIERHGGHANKLLGDGLMAVFGVPTRIEDHAGSAVRAACEIERCLAERYDGRLRVGIGLNSGTVVAGSMGGGGKLDYTIIGDAVNVAARVEACTRETGDTILMTETTRRRLDGISVELFERGPRSLKGRSGEVVLYAATAAGRPRS